MKANILRVMILCVFLIVVAIWGTSLLAPSPISAANNPPLFIRATQLGITCSQAQYDQRCADVFGSGTTCTPGEGFFSEFSGGCECNVCAYAASSSSSSSSSSSASSSPPIFAGRVPPSQTSTVSDSAAGGTAGCPGGDATATIPSGSVPSGTKVTCSKPNLNGLPNGTFRLGGVGDRYDALSFTDANGNPITSFNPPVTVCFNLTDADLANVNPYFYIDQWINGQWARVPFNWVAGTPNKVCTTVSSW